MQPQGAIGEALAQFCEVRLPSDQAIEVLSSRAHDIEESRMLQAMADSEERIARSRERERLALGADRREVFALRPERGPRPLST